jgi:hypothetical protein
VVDVMKFFGMKVTEFKRDWAAMSDKDKSDLKRGIADGSLNY